MMPSLSVEALDQTFVSLGFDAISKGNSCFFECSPLSCNYLAKKTLVNSFCLVDTLRDAIAFAKYCAIEQPEPGSYYVFEVLRQVITDSRR